MFNAQIQRAGCFPYTCKKLCSATQSRPPGREWDKGSGMDNKDISEKGREQVKGCVEN
jgi:hypothetical protein